MDRPDWLLESHWELIRRQISAGETVRWVGYEPGAAILRRRRIKIGGFALWMISAGLLAVCLIALNPDLVRSSLLSMLPALALVGLAALGSWLLIQTLRSPTGQMPDLYVITNRRALVLSAKQNYQVWSYGPEAISRVTVRRRKDGSGDIILESAQRWGADAQGRTTRQIWKVGFMGVARVDVIFQQLHQVSGRAADVGDSNNLR